MEYTYLFRLGRGKRALDFLGPSIGHFWNDIYDTFDLTQELWVKKLDHTEFTDSEIKGIARELFEDIDEDEYLIYTEIRNKELYFRSLGKFGVYELDGYLKAISIFSTDQRIVDIPPVCKEFFFHRSARSFGFWEEI